ncbi:MAG TPA: coenzyme F420-0:L-glutamate ligase [Candidatus Limnocylindrales bacterium]|nr:coenzyme F420-0:L-glutamate ligase [Candidatus Limnocylindrales bacterium]
MNIAAIKTPKLTLGSGSIFEILDSALSSIEEGSIIAVTSKIVSICEGNVIAYADIDKEELVARESNLYLPASLSKYGHHFTITNNTLIPMAGVDESNGEGYYILWPRDAQKTANDIRRHLSTKHGLKNVGVVITDSTCQPLRRGTTGISLAHSGFMALRNYIGKPDLFDRPFGVTQANVAGGLAAAAVLAMGEGAEQTPLCIISDVPAVVFTQDNPADKELSEITISLDEDLFAPFLTAVNWQQGKRGTNND